MPSSNIFLSLSLHFLPLCLLCVQALVPPSNTFKHVNEGDWNINVVEYGAYFRPLPFSNSMFTLCFYNTTPNAYTLGLLMGTTASNSLLYWVWEANRGNQVPEKATFSLGRDGNLILADADGGIVWQTHTANKGVVGFKLLPNGNMVLYDAKGRFVWQSFDQASDTLLMGQSFRLGGVTELVSRASDKVNINGPYSLVMESRRLAMYYTSQKHASQKYPEPLLYYADELLGGSQRRLGSIQLIPLETTEGPAMEIRLDYKATHSNASAAKVLTKVKYNATLSFLRLGQDGNFRIYTYDPNTRFYGAWEVTYAHFNRNEFGVSECRLPGRCGDFGLCTDNQCVGCPTANGIIGWTNKCEPKKLSGCGVKDFRYYKLEGVDHFTCKYTPGMAIKEEECSKNCTRDCNCLGYFYNRESSRCWLAYDLKTLISGLPSTHVGYIKEPNH